MNEQRQDRLSASLKELGESRLSADFTERVLDGLDRRLRRRARRRALGLVAGGVAVVVLAFGALRGTRPTAATATQAQADEIRREHRLLLEELEELRGTRELSPVLYLGGNDDYDLVLDLNPLLEEMTRESAVPASLTPATRPVGARETTRRQP